MLELIPLSMTLLALAGYGSGLHRLRRRGVRWPVTRVAAIFAGSLCVAAAVLPPIASHDELFPVHVAQHLLLGMAAPAFLSLSAPVTLALRRLPRRPRRILLKLLHSSTAAALAAPATAVVLDLGGLYALYLTGLYKAAEHDNLVHAAVHVHMLLAGCLLSWAVIGLDPIRRRPGTWVRLTALIIAAAGHDTLAKLIYAWNLPADGGPIASRHTGAELMYYGGTVIEVALAAVVMTQWYLVSGRALAQARRRSQSAGPQLPIALPSRRRGWAPLPLSHLDRISGRIRSVVAIAPDGLGTPLERVYQATALMTGRTVATLLAPVATLMTASGPGRSLFFAMERSRPWKRTRQDARQLLLDFANAPAYEETVLASMFDIPSGLDRIICPVLIMQGTANPLISMQSPRFLTFIPHAQFKWLYGLSHVPISDDPGLITRLMLDFLNTTAEGRSCGNLSQHWRDAKPPPPPTPTQNRHGRQ